MKALFILIILLASISTYAAFVTSDRTVQFRADGSNWVSDNVIDNLNSLPNTAPTITLTGASSVSYTVNATYSELGATCSDTEDGTITVPAPSFSPALDMSTAATYTATYTCTDSGSLTDTVTRTVVVSAGGFASFPYDDTRAVIAGAYHVDPVSGSDSNDGILVADGGTGAWLTISANLASLVAGDTVYLREGTHTVTNINMKFGHASGTVGNLIEVTSYPSEAPVIDANGLTTWIQLQNRNYWRFSHLKLINYINGWEVGEDITADNCEWYSLLGETPYGGDNVGLIKMREASNFDVDRIKVTLTVDPSTVHQNTGGLYHIDNNNSMSGTYNHIEAYNFQSGIYFKHGDNTLSSHNGNVSVSNSFLSGSIRNSIGYNPAGVKFFNTIFQTDVNLAEADGGEAGDWNWFDHCTIYAGINLRDQLTGATNNKLTNSIIKTLSVQGSSSVTSDSDYNLFIDNVVDGATSRNLASWQTANASDANSLQGTPTYAGADFATIAAYALANGSAGENASSTGTDIGANVALIGVLAE